MHPIGFIVLSTLAVVSAIMVITHRNPVISALALAANLIAIAGFYLLLGAQFIALLQVIVYAGAIMVLVLFVIMMLSLPDEKSRGSGVVQRWLGPVLALAFTVLIAWTVRRTEASASFSEPPEEFGTVGALGGELFTRFFYPFEVISLLLVVAMVGAVLLAKRRL